MLLNPLNLKNTIKQSVTQAVTVSTVNQTTVNQINDGAVVSAGGGVTFVQSNDNATNNIIENILKLGKK